jgi:CRISPR-associated protein Cas1
VADTHTEPGEGKRNRLISPDGRECHFPKTPSEDASTLSPIGQQALEALRSEAESAQIADCKSELAPSVPQLTARLLNEFVYCPRLFYYEHVEGLFLSNADTVRGAALHQKVDSGTGALPDPQSDVPKSTVETPPSDETIHARSVQLGSDRLGITAKLDLAEVTADPEDLFARRTACPVDYKAGSPRLVNGQPTIWDADKIQLGLQILLLRDNGYHSTSGIIYYRGTKQRVPLEMTPELEAWILQQIEAARALSQGPIPPPLVDSPKCVRCSLAPLCLPDETRLLQATADCASLPAFLPSLSFKPPRRLMAPVAEERALYLNTPGLHVGRSSEVLQVRDEGEVLEEIRISDLHHVALFGHIQISTQTIQMLCEKDIPVTYFSMGGWFYGLTRGHALKNIFTRIRQFARAADPSACLPLARQFIHGKIRNQRTLLQRNHITPPAAPLLRLKRASQDALAATSLPELLGIEGAAAALYFENFSGMLKPRDELDFGTETATPAWTFDFTHRNRRPPRDPVNALLSLAYSLLAKDCLIAAHATGFDPYLGFYHQPRFGRPALALDLMEEFRPLIADSTVLTLLNNHMLAPSDFVQAGNSCNLTPGGRKIFFHAYERRMQHLITHPVFDYKVSYRRALELQARLLAAVCTDELPAYTPFLTR